MNMKYLFFYKDEKYVHVFFNLLKCFSKVNILVLTSYKLDLDVWLISVLDLVMTT